MNYYSNKLSAERLKRCYEIIPPRIRQYLEAEVNHVLAKINPNDFVLELGCGYGRILPMLARESKLALGIDTSISSLQLAKEILYGNSNIFLVQMDAVRLALHNHSFDLVVCIQNGISAFHVDQKSLIAESIRVTKHGGTVLFSSYSEKFWNHRLEWFQVQSEAGLLGEIDYQKTKEGFIVCKDGFTASTVGMDQFLSLASEFNVSVNIVEVDKSSLFCEITV